MTYQRLTLQSPRPIVLHLVRADLRTPGIEILFTPVSAATYRPLKAATVSTFLRQSGAQVAINANFFFPFRASSPISYRPHENDPVQVAGITAYQGLLYQPHPFAPPADPAATLFVSKDGHPTFARPETIYNAISGDCFLVKKSQNIATPDPVEPLNARTAIGLDQSEQTLSLAVLDGKQPGYSEGATLPEFADLLLHAGIHTAIDLDGGGSSALVRQSPDHQPQLISSPTNFRMPWWERPVANHIGIKVSPTQ
jgi:exopolysaccharide biosynthesis protein